MKTVTGSTTNEKNMIKAIQAATGAVQDGMIGTQTMSDIARMVGADCFPLTLQIYSQPVIIAKDIVPFAPGTGLKNWTNSVSGSFSANGKPCSILVQNGIVKRGQSCHSWKYNKPESVLYKTKGGEIKIARVVDVKEIKDEIDWAVGGMGLLDNYDPNAEGFCRLTHNGKTENFSDVLRKTAHTLIGEKGGYIYLAYVKNMTAAQVDAYAKKLGLSKAVMLDGGHVAAINGTEKFAKINTGLKQAYAIQAKEA